MSASGFAVYDIHKLSSVIIFSYGSFWSQKNAFLYYIILEKIKQGLGRIITCSKICFSAHLFPSLYFLLFFIITNLSIFPSFSLYFNFFFFLFCSLFLKNVECCSKFPYSTATDRKCRARLYTINWITQRFIVDRHG